MVEERPMEEEQSEGGVDLSKRMQMLQEFAGIIKSELNIRADAELEAMVEVEMLRQQLLEQPQFCSPQHTPSPDQLQPSRPSILQWENEHHKETGKSCSLELEELKCKMAEENELAKARLRSSEQREKHLEKEIARLNRAGDAKLLTNQLRTLQAEHEKLRESKELLERQLKQAEQQTKNHSTHAKSLEVTISNLTAELAQTKEHVDALQASGMMHINTLRAQVHAAQVHANVEANISRAATAFQQMLNVPTEHYQVHALQMKLHQTEMLVSAHQQSAQQAHEEIRYLQDEQTRLRAERDFLSQQLRVATAQAQLPDNQNHDTSTWENGLPKGQSPASKKKKRQAKR